MKDIEEILKRAIVLLAFSDRCALEEKMIDGTMHTLDEREMQRQAILSWLKKNKYYDSLTKREQEIFDIPVVEAPNYKIQFMMNDYECIEPLLWGLGLVDKLSGYDTYVIQDFHPHLQFGRMHSFETLKTKCKLRNVNDIKNKRELAMLMYWRCLETNNNSIGDISIRDSVYSIFGEKYTKLLEQEKEFSFEKNDFIALGKTVADLDDIEVQRLSIISERRFYAFEWIFSDEDWDNVDLVC